VRYVTYVAQNGVIAFDLHILWMRGFCPWVRQITSSAYVQCRPGTLYRTELHLQAQKQSLYTAYQTGGQWAPICMELKVQMKGSGSWKHTKASMVAAIEAL